MNKDLSNRKIFFWEIYTRFQGQVKCHSRYKRDKITAFMLHWLQNYCFYVTLVLKLRRYFTTLRYLFTNIFSVIIIKLVKKSSLLGYYYIYISVTILLEPLMSVIYVLLSRAKRSYQKRVKKKTKVKAVFPYSVIKQ